MAGGLIPSFSPPVAVRSDEAREARREASADSMQDAQAFAQTQVDEFLRTNDRITPELVSRLRAQIANRAREGERFTEAQLTDVMTRVLNQQPPRPGSNDPVVRAKAAEPLPAEPVVAHDGPPNPGDPRPDDPNVLTRDNPDSPGAEHSRFVMKGGSNPNPNNPPPSPVVAAAYVPTDGAPPPPPPPGVAVPPLGPGVVTDEVPPPPPGSPLLAGSFPPPPGSPIIPGAPVLPGSVPDESPMPRVGGFMFASLGASVNGMEGEEQQQVYGELLNHAANLRNLTTVRTPIPFQMPDPRVPADGFSISDGATVASSEGDSSHEGGATEGGKTSGAGGTRRTFFLGLRRDMGYA